MTEKPEKGKAWKINLPYHGVPEERKVLLARGEARLTSRVEQHNTDQTNDLLWEEDRKRMLGRS